MIERWQEIREEITESTSVWDVYKLDANKVARFLEKIEQRIAKLAEVRVLAEEEKKPEGEEEKKPEGEDEEKTEE